LLNPKILGSLRANDSCRNEDAGRAINERQVASNLRKSFLENETWCAIIYDGMDFAERPFDMVSIFKSKLVAIELKFLKSFSAFGMRHMRESQIKNLNMVSESGALAFVFLNIWIPHKENRLLIWEWNRFKSLTADGTIKKKELEQWAFIQGKAQRFPVDKIHEEFSCVDTFIDL